MELPDPPLLFITDRHRFRQQLLDTVRGALAAGCRWISVREKDLSLTERCRCLEEVALEAARFGAVVSIHEDVVAACQTGIRAVHLPRSGHVGNARAFMGADALIGISTHDRSEAERAKRAGADYVTLSPIFESASKPGYGPALGLQRLHEIAASVQLPILALGGIDETNVADCLSSGAFGAAVIGAIGSAEDPEKATRGLLLAMGREPQS